MYPTGTTQAAIFNFPNREFRCIGTPDCRFLKREPRESYTFKSLTQNLFLENTSISALLISFPFLAANLFFSYFSPLLSAQNRFRNICFHTFTRHPLRNRTHCCTCHGLLCSSACLLPYLVRSPFNLAASPTWLHLNAHFIHRTRQCAPLSSVSYHRYLIPFFPWFLRRRSFVRPKRVRPGPPCTPELFINCIQ